MLGWWRTRPIKWRHTKIWPIRGRAQSISLKIHFSSLVDQFQNALLLLEYGNQFLLLWRLCQLSQMFSRSGSHGIFSDGPGLTELVRGPLLGCIRIRIYPKMALGTRSWRVYERIWLPELGYFGPDRPDIHDKGYAMSKFNEIDVEYLKERGLRHDLLPSEWQQNVTKCL